MKKLTKKFIESIIIFGISYFAVVENHYIL